MVEIAATATPPPSSEDDDYEDLDYGSKKKTEPVPVPREQAKVEEEVVAVEPIYTMVVKSPRIVQAFDQEPTDQPVNGVDHSEAAREAGDGQQAGESPVPWEYKLPAPPTPFQDSMPVAPPAESVVTATESSSRPTSSMSVDSLQENLETETPVPETGVMLQSGADLLEESVTEEMLSKYLYCPVIRGINSTDWNQRRMSFIHNQLPLLCLHCRPHLRLLKVTKTTMFTRPIFHWILICAFPSPPTIGVLQRILLTTRSCRAPIRRT